MYVCVHLIGFINNLNQQLNNDHIVALFYQLIISHVAYIITQ